MLAYIRTVAAAALGRFDEVAAWLGLADGKNQGREYLPLNPLRADHKSGSFTINRDSGAWADFASGDKGGDLVSLCAYLKTCTQGDAARKLAGFLGLDAPKSQGPQNRATSNQREAGKAKVSPSTEKASQRPESAPGAACVMPVPDDAPAPPKAHPRHGKPAMRWPYVAADGRVNFYHDRYEPAGERKQFAPLSLWRKPGGALVWQFKAPTAPRPLLGLPDLAVRHTPAVFVEGEKARDAAARLLPDHPALTWQGGAQAVAKADFSPLAGRECWIWSDNDEAGEKAARDVAAALVAAGAGPVKCFDLARFAVTAGQDKGLPTLTSGGEWNTGDDAADLVARGWTAGHMALLLPGVLAPVASAAPAAPPGGTTSTAPAPESKPQRFELTERGVMFHETDKAPRWICAPLDVSALVRNPNDKGWGLLTEFSDPDRNPHRVIIPMSLFKGDGAEVAGLLLDEGLKLAPKGKPLLVEYLQTRTVLERARVTNRTGWHDAGSDGAVFVLPDHAIGTSAGAWIFDGDGPANTFALRGTLRQWQSEVAVLCVENSRLVFAVSAAFATPLLYLTGNEGGGFHFRSNSSDGKTTALRVAASVCGGPDYMERWRATDNGLEALAMQHCDALLLLDELAQIDPKAAGEVAYMLANGGGKARAGRTGGARERASWRVLFLSAGEIGLSEHMGQIGQAPKAGQELRLAEIPADAGVGLGVFENLHGYKGGNEFSKALNEAARRYHGGAFIAFLGELVKRQGDIADVVKDSQRLFDKTCLTEDAHGQARRVAGRFALVGAGGELATKWGITGWAPGEAMAAARKCFEAWLSRRGGESNQEERIALMQVREFLRRYGESAFTDWYRPANDTDKHAAVRSDRAGYRRNEAASDEVDYFIFNEVWRTRVCKGLDPAAVGRLLVARGYVEAGKEKDRPWLVREQLPAEGRARVVRVLPAIWQGDDD